MRILTSIYPDIQKNDIYLGNYGCKGTMESDMILVFHQGLQNCSTVETVRSSLLHKDVSQGINSHVLFVCLIDLILYVPSTIVQLNRDSLPGLNQH